MSVSYQDQSGSGMGGGSQYRIPDELQEILLDFTVNYLIEQPSDIARWVTDLVSDIGYPKPGYMKPGFWFLEELCGDKWVFEAR